MNIDVIWHKIISLEGEIFYTKTNKEFKYKINGKKSLTPSRTEYNISKTDFKKALDKIPLEGPGKINSIVRGPAYVYGILMDKRVCG